MIPLEESSVSEAYHHKYAGKTLLLKVSGQTLLSADMPALVDDVRSLARDHIRFILVCGAGEQNTRFLKDHCAATGQPWVEPLRVGGRRVTDERQMEHGVLPAHRSIQAMFRQWMPEAAILEPSQVRCRQLSELGYVGDPQSVDGLDGGGIVVIPSVGSDGQVLLNVNADDTARAIAQQEGERLNEAIFVTEKGGVLHNDRIAPLLWREDIAPDGTHAFIDVTGGGGGMQKKLCEARKMLDHLSKVVITGVAGVRQEIERILGSGTLVVSRAAVRCEQPPHEADDDAIFDALYAKNVASGNFRSRSEDELRELRKHVRLLKVSNSVLGAFAQIPRGGHWTEVATICSDYPSSGIGDVILREAQKTSDALYAFASSPESAALFARNDFAVGGPVSAVRKEHPTFYDCLPCIPQYALGARDPVFCTWRRQQFPVRK